MFPCSFLSFCSVFPLLTTLLTVDLNCNVHMMCSSIVVSAGLLRIFGRGIAELPIVATSKEHQGKVRTYHIVNIMFHVVFS